MKVVYKVVYKLQTGKLESQFKLDFTIFSGAIDKKIVILYDGMVKGCIHLSQRDKTPTSIKGKLAYLNDLIV